MRYIKKIAIKDLDKNINTKPILDYIHAERNPANPPMHPSFAGMKSDSRGNTQKSLTKQLLKEQYGICCFCQENVFSNHLIEHFQPQSIFKNEEVDYYNLLLSCKTQGQCSDFKKEYLIGKFMTHSNCESFFMYNWTGQIVPKCNFSLWEGDNRKGCKENLYQLTSMQKQAFVTIEILGLNNQSLLLRRVNQLFKDDFQKILSINKTNLTWLKEQQAKYVPSGTTIRLPEFSSMFLFFINQAIEKQHGKENI